MKTKWKNLTGIIVVVCCFAAFAVIARFSFYQPEHTAGNPVSDVPYGEPTIENQGLLFVFYEGGSVFLNFDFLEDKISVMLFDSAVTPLYMRQYGYEVNNCFKADYHFLANFIDRFGGVVFSYNDSGIMRYTGVQVTEMLASNNDKEFKKTIIQSFFKKIDAVGITQKDLLYLIDNTTTDMSFPEGYDLLENTEGIFKNIHFIN